MKFQIEGALTTNAFVDKASVILDAKSKVKPGFHSNAIACVGKQPIMVAIASTEHSYWLALVFVA